MKQTTTRKRGFTLIEVVLVITILGIIATIAFPALAAYIEKGNQDNRDNIARTLYLAAQNRLMDMQLNETLKPEITGQFYKIVDDKYTNTYSDTAQSSNVYGKIGAQYPLNDDANKGDVFFITKDAGFPTAGNPVVDLLDPVVVDKSILHNAICIEFNVRTGVVLSVFYSDVAPRLEYNGAGDDSQINNIVGTRTPYTQNVVRRQGYYGVDNTGQRPPLTFPVVANIYDGANKPLERVDENVLYGEFFLSNTITNYSFEITDKSLNTLYQTGNMTLPADNGNIADAMSYANTLGNKNQLIYRTIAEPGSVIENGIDLSANYYRYVWLIDYIDGDIYKNGQPHNIQDKYKINVPTHPDNGESITPQDLRVRAKAADNDPGVSSLSVANSHFYDKGSLHGTGAIKTARHLNNIRYYPTSYYRQIADINMTKITNFQPIANFSGQYSALNTGSETNKNADQFVIKNLTIDTTGVDPAKNVTNVGLFANAIKDPDATKGAEIFCVSLINANITATAGGNVGSIVGHLENGILKQSNSYANVTASGGATLNAGGLVGYVESNGAVGTSYNGGYFDATGRQSDRIGYVKATHGNVGGIVGHNSGVTAFCYNNARVNVDTVKVDTTGPEAYLSKEPTYTTTTGAVNIGGIAGSNSGLIRNTYATNFVGNYEKNSECGGIVGKNTGTAQDSYYLNNSHTDDKAVSKAELQAKPAGLSEFLKTTTPYVQGKNQAADYPYPTLEKNRHITGWEDIFEEPVITDAKLVYYEYYQDKTWGYSNNGTLTNANLVVNDGYLLDLPYSQYYTITIAGDLVYELKDTANNSKNPVWTWTGINQMTQKPVKYTITVAGKEVTRYRLFLDNATLEAKVNQGNPIKIALHRQSTLIFEQSFNPLFGNAIGTGSPYAIRSPRHLDNIDLAATKANATVASSLTFNQQLNLDFEVYRKQLNATSDNVIESSSLVMNGAAVDAKFYGIYNGQNHFVRHMNLPATNDNLANPTVDGDKGMFAQVGGTVQNVALLRSEIEGSNGLGGIAGEVIKDGTIEFCELSEVVIKSIEQQNKDVGGVVGRNSGTIQNVYFNSTYRDATTNIYSSPILGTTTGGGLVGTNKGILTKAYITAVGPNHHPTIGWGDGAGSEVYYLTSTGYNANPDVGAPNQGEGVLPDAEKHWNNKLTDGDWEKATISTTRDTILCKDIAYPYPKITNMDHYYDWPILVTTLQYYEKYSDGTYGYYYYINKDKPVDALKYNPDLTVVEEGYIIDAVSTDNYDIRFNGETSTQPDFTNRTNEVMDNKRVIKLGNLETENLFDSNKIDSDGFKSMRIQASAHFDTNNDGIIDDKDFINELYGLTTDGFIFFNPLFGKTINLSDATGNVKSVNEFDIRSPRHMMNINKINPYKDNYSSTVTGECWFEAKHGDPWFVQGSPLTGNDKLNAGTYTYNGAQYVISWDSFNQRYKINKTTTISSPLFTKTIEEVGYVSSSPPFQSFERTISTKTIVHEKYPTITYNQTISLNFASTVIDGRPIYQSDATDLTKVGKNVVTDFNDIYDGKVINNGTGSSLNDSGRPLSCRIYNLQLNVPDKDKLNIGSTFGDISANSQVKNLEFVNPQIRFANNGMGGGIVSNIAYGEIDNVNVYNTRTQSLFANRNGSSNAVFCANRTTHNGELPNGYKMAHLHGGIAAAAYGPKAKITNCVVGTNSTKIGQIYDNKTKVNCFPYFYNDNSYNDYNVAMGGITGLTGEGAQIIACTNIADISPNLSQVFPGDTSAWASTHSAGGITGSTMGENSTYNTNPFSARLVGCYNAGSIRLNFGFLGGITGVLGGSTNKNAYAISCYNTGRVNIEHTLDANGKIQLTPIRNTISLRIGGIAGQTKYGQFNNCYNVGYMSGKLPAGSATSVSRTSGAIFGLPSDGAIRIENCFSLAADQERARGLIGDINFLGGASVNGITDEKEFKRFEGYWISRTELRNSDVLISPNHTNEGYIGLGDDLGTGPKNYPVFNKPSGFYIYPSLSSFNLDGTNYTNPHITPWEYIDSVYDTTLKYYEKYTDGTYGEYYIDLRGDVVNDLSTADKVVKEEGYFFELGTEGKYTVQINETYFNNLEAKKNVLELGSNRIGIAFTQPMIEEAIKGKNNDAGYSKVRLFTQSGKHDDDIVNRLLGTGTVRMTPEEESSKQSGNDLFFNFNFPREIKLTDWTKPVNTLKPSGEAYGIRSPRHLDSIGKLTTLATNGTTGKTFKQEIDISFTGYNFAANPGFTTVSEFLGNTFRRSVVKGIFEGIYEGDYNTITGPTINSADPNIGLFDTNKGTIRNLKIENPIIISKTSTTNLNVGVVAGVNQGNINVVAVHAPSISVAKSSQDEIIGGIIGHNTTSGSLKNAYVVSNSPSSPIQVEVGATNPTYGGIIGKNEGYLDYILYLALAPGTAPKLYPIAGANTGTSDNTLYLGGNNYNEFVETSTIGTPKTVSQFAAIRDAWGANTSNIWGSSDPYPYPSLVNIGTTPDYPSPAAVGYTLAYYEKYADNTYGYYNPETNFISSLDDIKVISDWGYCIMLANDYTDPTNVVSFGTQKVIKLTDSTATDVTAKLAELNRFTMPDDYTYYGSAFAKAITKGAKQTSLSLRAESQMLSINGLTDTKDITFTQEKDLDFQASTFIKSVIENEFAGKFDGNGKIITNLTINADSEDNIGLFSQNKGTIQNVTIKPTNNPIIIKGKDNVGLFAGSNLQGGQIDACIAEAKVDTTATPYTFTEITIDGNNNVGGISGTNTGEIKNCSLSGQLDESGNHQGFNINSVSTSVGTISSGGTGVATDNTVQGVNLNGTVTSVAMSYKTGWEGDSSLKAAAVTGVPAYIIYSRRKQKKNKQKAVS